MRLAVNSPASRQINLQGFHVTAVVLLTLEVWTTVAVELSELPAPGRSPACEDRYQNCSILRPQVCTNPQGQIACSKACNLCEPNGTICHVCKDVLNPDDCHNTTVCKPGLECFVQRLVDVITGDVKFEMGCSSSQLCQMFSIAVGRRQANHITTCYQCCKSDSCSPHLCSVQVKTTKPSTTTHLSVTTKTPRSTAPPMTSTGTSGPPKTTHSTRTHSTTTAVLSTKLITTHSKPTGSTLPVTSTARSTSSPHSTSHVCPNNFVNIHSIGCGGNQDIIVLVGLGQHSLSNQTRHVVNFIHRLTADRHILNDQNSTKMAVAYYHSTATTIVNLTSNREHINNLVDASPLNNVNCVVRADFNSLKRALEHSLVVFSLRNGGRATAHKVVLVILDEMEETEMSLSAIAHRLIRDSISVNIVSLGRPSSFLKTEVLKEIASLFGKSDDHLLNISSAATIDTALAEGDFDSRCSRPK